MLQIIEPLPSTYIIDQQKIIAFFLRKKSVIVFYMFLAIVVSIKQYLIGSINNYLIFKYTYWHSINLQNLYIGYPEYYDNNHYGPVFALLIAPFALLPDAIGSLLWNIANVSVLLWGIFSLPISLNNRVIIAWICAHEALTAILSFQFNLALTGFILLTFSNIYKQKEVKSAFFIVLGALVKLYGIVGLAFFFFSKNKIKFILWGLAAFILLFVLPMILSSPSFIVQSYADWYQVLVWKNSSNVNLISLQDISFLGMVRRILQNPNISNLPLLVSGLFLFAIPYLRVKQYKYLPFQLMLLSSTLIFTVIFSTGSESPTYIIAFAGVAIWFLNKESEFIKYRIFLFVFAIILTSLSPSDLFPELIRKQYVQTYSLKALPCVIIWLDIIYQMLIKDFKHYSLNR